MYLIYAENFACFKFHFVGINTYCHSVSPALLAMSLPCVPEVPGRLGLQTAPRQINHLAVATARQETCWSLYVIQQDKPLANSHTRI